MRLKLFLFMIFMIGLLFIGCGKKNPFFTINRNESIHSILTKNEHYRVLDKEQKILVKQGHHYMLKERECIRYESLWKYKNIKAIEKIENDFQQLCKVQKGYIEKDSKKIFKNYPFNILKPQKYNLCFSELRPIYGFNKEKRTLYCMKNNNQILFVVDISSIPRVTIYKNQNILNKYILLRQSLDKKLKKQFKKDIKFYTNLINNNKDIINTKSFDKLKKLNNKYYFQIIPNKFNYNQKLQEIAFDFNFYDIEYGIKTSSYINEEFTNKLLNRVTKVNIIRIKDHVNFIKENIYSSGTTSISYDIKFYTKYNDKNRYMFIAEIEIPLDKKIEKECTTINGYSYQEASFFKKVFNKDENAIKKYKNADCTKKYVFEFKKLNKLIIYDKILHKVVYIAYNGEIK